jgi:trans-aconitate methyltransferase
MELTPAAAGYRTEATYPLRLHRELNPRRFGLALAAQGLAAASCDQPYTYMELGFGQGLSLVSLAAANPHARFHGIDLMAEHVEHVRGLAIAAGLTNLHVRQMSFADLAANDWPMFDYVAAHGVWSWVTAELRAQIKRFVDAKLKSGGVLYLSYNAEPGWAAMAPLRKVMKHTFDSTVGTLESRIQAALKAARDMEQAEALYFRANPSITIRLKHLQSETAPYLAHEYFNAAWDAFHVADVADVWRGLGLTFAGSATLQDNVTDLTIRPEARALFDAAQTIIERETLKDFLLNKQFRRDLYVRGPRVLDDAELAAAHGAARFTALKTPADLAEAKLTTEIMTTTLNAPIHRALVESLQKTPRTLSELSLPGLNPNAAFGTLYLLTAMNALAPAAKDAVIQAAALPVDKLNAEFKRRSLPARVLASVGGGVLS